MMFCDLHWFSKVLGKQVSTYVVLPDEGPGPFPVLYLLHGLSDDHTIWLRRSRIEWYVRNLPLIVVMPDGYRGFYTNNDAGPAYATYMAEELPEKIETWFPASRVREGRCISGLSMGGYGAFRLALGYPDKYVSATSHSGALTIGSRRYGGTALAPAEFQRIFGTDPAGSDHDLIELARRAKTATVTPALRFDCGVEDVLLDQNREFHRALLDLDIPHEYQEFPGSHTWDYWDQHIRESLALHCRYLGISSTVS